MPLRVNTLMFPPEVLPWEASYKLVWRRTSSIESGDGTGTLPKLLLPRLLESMPLMTKLLAVPR